MTEARASVSMAAGETGGGFSVELDAKAFASTLAQVSRACAKRSAVAALCGVRLEASGEDAGALELRATDAEVSMRSAVEASAVTPGAAVLADPKALLGVLKTLTGPVTVAQSENGAEVVVVSWSGARYAFPTLPVEDFPAWPDGLKPAGEVEAAPFVASVSRVMPAVSKDVSRPVLGAVPLTLDGESDTVGAAGCDSYRLSVDTRPANVSGFLDVLAPGRMLAEVVRVAKAKGAPEFVAFAASELHVAFTVGALDVAGRRVDGQYPDIDRLRPDKFELEARLDGGELGAAARRVAAVLSGRDSGTPLRLAVDAVSGAVTVSARGYDGGEASETLPTAATVTGALEGECGFNAAFLADALAFTGPDVRVQLVSPLRPAVFLNGSSDAWHLLMPVRLAR